MVRSSAKQVRGLFTSQVIDALPSRTHDQSHSQRSKHMGEESTLLARVGQGLLAVAATGATVLALQIAMLAT